MFPLSMSLALRLARAVTCRAGIALSWYKVWVSSGQLSFTSDTFTYNVYVMVGMIKKIIIVLPILIYQVMSIIIHCISILKMHSEYFI